MNKTFQDLKEDELAYMLVLQSGKFTLHELRTIGWKYNTFGNSENVLYFDKIHILEKETNLNYINIGHRLFIFACLDPLKEFLQKTSIDITPVLDYFYKYNITM